MEGHVPREAVERLFEEEPAALGVAAPGMPRYSPGTGPRGDEPLTISAFEETCDAFEYVDVCGRRTTPSSGRRSDTLIRDAKRNPCSEYRDARTDRNRRVREGL